MEEKRLGVEDARAQLGRLVDQVAEGGEPIEIMKWGRSAAVLVSREEYSRLKASASAAARASLRKKLKAARDRVRAAGLDAAAVDEAIAAARDVD
jgi:prevent-host-death family protein